MPRNYQTQKNNPYYIPHNIYMQVQYKLKDYDRLMKEKLDILYAPPKPPDGMPKGNGTSSTVEDKAVKRDAIDRELAAIDQGAVMMIASYANAVYDDFNPIKAYWSYNYYNYMHIRKHENDHGPSRRKWNYFKSILTGIVAKNLKLF